MPFRSDEQRRWMHANKPEMARRWAAHTPKVGKMTPQPSGRSAGGYFDHLCGKCGGIRRDRMVGKMSKLPMIGKDCGCPKTHGKKGVVEFQKKGQLPIIGKWSDTQKVIGKVKLIADRLDATEPKGPMGPAPKRLVGKQHFNGVNGIERITPEFKRLLSYISTEKLEDHAEGSPDIRPSMEAMNYTTSAFNLHPGRCSTCNHAHDSFVANDHGFMVTGLRCVALRGEPMVAKAGRCDLWTGPQHAEKSLVPASSLTKARPSGGGWQPIPGGRKGGMRRRRGGRWQYWYPSPLRERRAKKRQEREQLLSRLRAKIRRKGPGEGREVQLTKAELDIVLSSGKFALVSAGKNPRLEPGMTKDQEQRRHGLLRSRLVDDGFAFTQVVGHYEGIEDSFLVMVHDANREHVRSIGREFNQDSVIFAEGGKQEMHFTTGDHAQRGECHEGRGFEYKPDAEDYYTDFPHPNGDKSKFSLNFNWGSLVPCRKSMHYFGKAMNGGGPRYYAEQSSMPDFQFIYHQPESDEKKKKEREAFEIRRRAMADKNKGKFGFHGEAPEPQLRAEPSDFVPASQYGGRRLKDKAPKPRQIPPRIFAKMTSKKPPPGFKPAPRSKKGGYVKTIGGKKVYWYPGKPWPKEAAPKATHKHEKAIRLLEKHGFEITRIEGQSESFLAQLKSDRSDHVLSIMVLRDKVIPSSSWKDKSGRTRSNRPMSQAWYGPDWLPSGMRSEIAHYDMGSARGFLMSEFEKAITREREKKGKYPGTWKQKLSVYREAVERANAVGDALKLPKAKRKFF